APAGVLFLENGGGKSVLLKLIFSVMLPGHRNTLGGASSGVLRKFLLADDCGHVALEWQHTLTGECVVVGKVSEWRGRQVSNDPRKFAEAWYSFRPGPGLSLDSLPVAESSAVGRPAEGVSGARGRRRTMKGFRDALMDAGKFYAHLDVHWEEIHDRWNEHLGDLGLDPELFRYQREMNADEGEAAGLFAVKKDSDFTDLLLRAVTDTRDTDGLADLVSGFGNKLGRRAELTAERDFTAGSVDLLNRIVEATDTRARARDIHAGAERRTRTLARRLTARAAEERGRTAELAERVTAAAHTVTEAESTRGGRSLIAAELAYRHASLALTAAEKSAAAGRKELVEARTLHAAWQAAEAVLRHRAAADRSTRVAVAIREAERDAAPALAARDEDIRTLAATDLVRALHRAAEEGERVANEEEERSDTLQATGERAHRDATVAATEAQRARSEAGHLRQRLAEVGQETAEAVRAGWLDDTAPDADPARAALAASDAEQSAVAAWDTAREAARAAADTAREAAAAESRADLAAARAADGASAAEQSHEDELRAAQSIAADPRLGDLLGLPSGSGVPHPRRGAADEPSGPDRGSGARPGPGADGGTATAAEPGADRAVALADQPGPAQQPLTAEEFDRSADELRDLLDQSVAAAERRLFDLRTAAADDARILGALGEGGLLPPGPDVLATVEYLGEHGIPALPGWRYLAQAVDPADHAAVLAARPELVDGVVITDPDAHTRAREVLGGAALLPRSAVAVGTAAALLAPVPAPGTGSEAQHDGVFLVPPNPAMHDEHAADEERHALRSRAAARDEDIRTLAARLSGDRALAARIGSWRADCPPGMLAELAEAAATARTTAESAEAVLAEARTARAEADEAAADTARVRDERQEAAQRARRAADALAGLAHRLRERAGWQVRLRELVDEAAESEARAAVCLDLARAADEDRRAAQRAGDDARRTARALRAERAEIAGVPEVLPEPDGTAARTALPTLREAYRAASQLYEKVGVGADLRAEQARAESDESAALAELDRLTNKVRTRAAQLLEGTDGADGPSRQAAAARAEAHVQLLETRASTASEHLGRLRGEAERLAPDDERQHHTELPDGLVPSDAEGAQALLRTATAELAAATGALDTARAAHSELLHAHRTAEDSAGGFDETAALLRDLLRDHGTEDGTEHPDPYPGTLEEARQSAAESRRSLRGCNTDLSAAESAVREASDVLVRHANSTRYEQVRTPARQQIRELPASALPEHAQKWADAFAPRLRVLTDELIQLERNRDSIVDRLRGLVDSALTTLRSAQRLSQLPEGLGEWSGQEFLRIRFEEPDQATLTERLGEVVDEATHAALKKNSDLRRDGMSLLLRGVEAALRPKGIAVEILKPDAVLRAERVPVGQMGDVFSGGQLLTAAIALYCTMAALRSNDRGRDRHRHAGTLFLDNPIGRANATYLLELQRAVSDALGVQLLYTTGLFDTTALAEFPLVIRLRNDADLRAGLKYISVEEHLRPGLPQQDPDGETVHGEITATRMFKRNERAAAETPAPRPGA
ncbi:hypothetical protein, partial [Streptomyces sp. McG3]|uniref:hypothetical protein n=1 Tax=Streptomyces sp. McG3 TaxID=2725483 RepID=UPI002037007F